MKKTLIFFMALVLFAPTFAFSNIVTFKLGYFVPRAQSDLWKTEFDQMDLKKSEYSGSNFGLAFEYFVTRRLSLVLSIDAYSKNKLGTYKGYVGYTADTLGMTADFAFPDVYEGEFPPAHTFNVSITPLQLSLKLTPLGRKQKLIPYIGGGIGAYLWNVRLQGDMIDFSDDINQWYYNEVTFEIHQGSYNPNEDILIYPIWLTDAREENKVTIGYHAFAGFMIPIANRTTLELEFKYNSIKGKLEEAFQGFEPFDLGGYQVSLGINYWF